MIKIQAIKIILKKFELMKLLNRFTYKSLNLQITKQIKNGII